MSNSLWPHGLNNVVHGILQTRILEWVAISFSKACMHAKSLQSCPTLFNPVDSSPPSSSAHGILQARIWNGLPFPSPLQTNTYRLIVENSSKSVDSLRQSMISIIHFNCFLSQRCSTLICIKLVFNTCLWIWCAVFDWCLSLVKIWADILWRWEIAWCRTVYSSDFGKNILQSHDCSQGLSWARNFSSCKWRQVYLKL